MLHGRFQWLHVSHGRIPDCCVIRGVDCDSDFVCVGVPYPRDTLPSQELSATANVPRYQQSLKLGLQKLESLKPDGAASPTSLPLTFMLIPVPNTFFDQQIKDMEIEAGVLLVSSGRDV